MGQHWNSSTFIGKKSLQLSVQRSTTKQQTHSDPKQRVTIEYGSHVNITLNFLSIQSQQQQHQQTTSYLEKIGSFNFALLMNKWLKVEC